MSNDKNTRTIIGIDFGSTQSSVVIMKRGSRERPDPLCIQESKSGIVPTRLALRKSAADDKWDVVAWGHEVRKDKVADPDVKIVTDFKRYLGCEGKAPSNDPEKDIKDNAEEYTRLFLEKLADFVRVHEGGSLSPDDYITCVAHPAKWTPSQRDLLKKLVEEAGFPAGEDGIRLIAEPIAAMHSQRVSDDKELLFTSRSEHYMVFDFGGGTLDISIVKTDIQNPPEPIYCGGDPELGGRDFDEIIKRLYFRRAEDKTGRNCEEEYEKASFWTRLEIDKECRRNKEEMSLAFSKDKAESYRLNFNVDGEAIDFKVEKDNIAEKRKDEWRGHFADLINEVEKCINNVIKNLREGKNLPQGKIKKVILTGGSSKLFFIDELLKSEFGFLEENIYRTETPYTDVAVGAAVSLGRTGEPEAIPGVYLRFCLNPKKLNPETNEPEECDWSQPTCILQPRRKRIAGSQEFTITKTETQYVTAQHIWIELSQGLSENDRKRTHLTVVDFFARSNFPLKQKFQRIWKAATSSENFDVNDEYKIIFKIEEKDSGTPIVYRWRIEDRNGNEIENGDLINNRLSYRGYLGLGERKEIVRKK